MTIAQNLAFVFPGQGSQKVGMLVDFAGKNAVFNEVFTEASELLGYDLWSLIQQGPQEKLNMTEVTQPALLVSSIALWRLWQEKNGPAPAYVAGHSLGEWSALVCAGVVDFADAVNLVRLRGKYMQEAVPVGVGAMAAIIGLEDEEVEEACREASANGEVVAAVNYNSPGQLVIAGEKNAVEKAIVFCNEAKAKRAMPLPVSAPFHTSLMKPAAEKLANEIEKVQFRAPKIAVVHNVDAATENDPDKIKKIMIQQIYSAVRWVDCVKTLASSGVTSTVECGPGKVLSGLIRRIDNGIKLFATESESSFNETFDIIKSGE